MAAHEIAPPETGGTATTSPGHPVTTPEMGGPLLVTPAHTTLVATDAMHAHLERLAGLERELADAARRLRAIESRANWAGVPGAPASARRSDAELADAIAASRAAHDTVERLVEGLRRAIRAYDDADRAAHERWDRAGAVLGAEFGALLRTMLPTAVLLGTAAWLVSKAPDPGGARASALEAFFLDHPGLITGPRFVEGVRLFASGLDEAMSSFAGVPVPLAVALGAAGITGVRSSARTLLQVGPLLGVFRETPVTVDRVTTTRLSGQAAAEVPAVGAVGRLDRVPEVNQVRIEKYDAPGEQSRFIVYVGPTESFSPVAAHEPWDLTSNVGGVGGLDVGAFRATELAMDDAGISAGAPVQFVGFSEGGLVATMLAGSGEWNAAGLQTFGAPAGNIHLPSGLEGMAIRNTDDFIPMLAGPQLDHQLVQVERQVFSPGTALPTFEAAPAHQRDGYRATAIAVDAASSSAVRQQNAALDAFAGDVASRDGASVTVMTYHGERLPDSPLTTAPRVVTTESPASAASR
jgi:hypothetical protein